MTPQLQTPVQQAPATVNHRVLETPSAQMSAYSPVSFVSTSPTASRVALFGLIGLRLALGFEFLWAFFDKTFGLGYATPAARAWVNGGSPTTGFLKGAGAGPFASTFQSLAGVSAIDWLFMLGLLGIGAALMVGVAVRPAAIAGSVMLGLMYLAVWVAATTAGGQPTDSVNPIVDEHIIGIFGLIVIAGFAKIGGGYLGRIWGSLPIVKSQPWLR